MTPEQKKEALKQWTDRDYSIATIAKNINAPFHEVFQYLMFDWKKENA